MNSFYIFLIGSLLLSGVTGNDNTTTTIAPTSGPTTAAPTTAAPTTAAPTTAASTTAAPTTEAPTSVTSAPSAAPSTTTSVVTSIYSTTSGPSTKAVSYYATDASGVVCIVLNATIKFSLPYSKFDPTTNTTTTASTDFYLPTGGSTGESSCSTLKESKFGQLLKVTAFYDDWTFQLFYENFTSNFGATMLVLDYTVKANGMFFGASNTSYKASVSYYGSEASPLFSKASISGYYFCNAESSISLNSSVANTNGKVTFSGLTTFAFGTQNNTNVLSGTKTECTGDKKPDDYIVPIAVGCALAAVILVVLIAYIIGRYRSRNTYQNV